MSRNETRHTSSSQRRLTVGTAVSRAYEPFVPGPNPELPEFIARHATAYDLARDEYDVKAFDRDLAVDKATPPKAIYDMHTYWSKKHWAAIREYVRHYLPAKHYPRGTGLVLDCFSGSGMTGVAAMMEDRPCVLIDASPAAAFISHCYTHPVDPAELQAAYDRMMTEDLPGELKARLQAATGGKIKTLTEELDWLYETRCDRCGGEARTEYVVYSERFQCPACAEVVALFDCPEAKVPHPVGGKKANKTEFKKKRVCPRCLAAHHNEPRRHFVISTRANKFGAVPVLVRYRCLGRCKPAADDRRHDEDARTKKGRYFKEYDLAKIAAIDKAEIPHWYPNRKMMDVEDDAKPWGTEWRPGRNFRAVAELYTKRNLWALGALKAAIRREARGRPAVEVWNMAFTAVSMNASRMYRFRPSGKGGLAMGTYYIPQLSQVMRANSQFADKRNDVLTCEAALGDLVNGSGIVSQQSSEGAPLPDASFDYIFTDPAYVGKIQYGELNFIWESRSPDIAARKAA